MSSFARWLRPPSWPERRASSVAAGFSVFEQGAQSEDALAGAVALLGAPDELGVQLNGGRPGAAQGPAAFRAALGRYGAVAARQWPRVVDVGDLLVSDALDETHERLSEVARGLVLAGALPVMIGGGHDLTFPFVRGVVQGLRVRGELERLDGIYLDAHLDVREQPGSGMPFRALRDGGFVDRLHAQGVDSMVNAAEHRGWFLAQGGAIDDLRSDGPWPARERFFSVCLDVVDQAFAPGVSATHPAGWSSRETAAWCRRAGVEPSVRCFDIMELSPPHDHGGRTARLAAHLFLSFLAGLGERRAS